MMAGLASEIGWHFIVRGSPEFVDANLWVYSFHWKCLEHASDWILLWWSCINMRQLYRTETKCHFPWSNYLLMMGINGHLSFSTHRIHLARRVSSDGQLPMLMCARRYETRASQHLSKNTFADAMLHSRYMVLGARTHIPATKPINSYKM